MKSRLMNNSLRGGLYSFLAFLLFSLMDTMNKLGLSYNIPFFNFVLMLDLFTAIIILISGFIIYKNALFKTQNYIFIIIRALIAFCTVISSLYAVSHLPLHVFYSITLLGPLIAGVLASFWLKESIRLSQFLFLILGFVGTMIVLIHPEHTKSHFILSTSGVLIAFVIPFSNALNGILVRKYMPSENAFTVTFYNLIITTTIAALYISIGNNSFHLISFTQLIFIIAASFFAGFGIIFSIKSFQTAKVINISHFQYTQIVFGVITGFLIFNNIPSYISMIGIFIIIASNIIMVKISKRISN